METLKEFLGFCKHEYETVEVATNVVHSKGREIPVGNIYFQECKKCKKMRKYTL